MSAYNNLPWKKISGQFSKSDPQRYLNKDGALQTGYTGSELRCYDDCKRQPESMDDKNEFKSSVNSIDDKCYCSFRPKSKGQLAVDKREPTVVELNVKQFEFEMMMREYRSMYDKYMTVVADNSAKDSKIYSKKNVKELYEMDPKVRYVKVQNRRNQYLHFQEIEVYDQNGKNVAVNQTKPKLHWYTNCNQCGKNICDSKNYKRMNNTDISASYFSGGPYTNNSFNKGGPGRVSEVGCCDIDDKQKAIVDTTYGGIFGVGKYKKNNNQNKTTVTASSNVYRGFADNVIDGMKNDNQTWSNSNHTKSTGIQWVELDLHQDVSVSKITIYNRPDCCQYRLNGAVILLYNSKRERIHEPIKLNSGRVQHYPIELKSQPQRGFIKQLFLNSVTQEQCFDDCAHDDDCKYVLFKKEHYNNGQGQRTRNRCLKYDKSAGGLIDVNDKDRNFQHNAWEKDNWKDFKNKDAVFGSDWSVNLGPSNSLKVCKDTAIKSEEGPFSSVVFVDDTYNDPDKQNTCYGNSLTATNNMTDSTGVHSSIPPGGETGKVDDEEQGILTELVNLNKKISSHMSEIANMTNETIGQGKSNSISSASISSAYNKQTANRFVQRLENDKKQLLKMSKEIEDANASNENLELNNMSNKMKLYVMVLLSILLVTICVLYMSERISSSIVYSVLAVFFIFMYMINYTYYNSLATYVTNYNYYNPIVQLKSYIDKVL